MGDTIIKNKQTVTAPKQPDHKLSVAIVDNFSPSFAFNMSDESVFTKSDYQSNIAHGQIVRRFIEEGLSDAQIEQFNIKSAKSGSETAKGISTQLGIVLQNITKKGKKYDALNLSMSKDLCFDDLPELNGKKITPENLSQFRDYIKKLILVSDTSSNTKQSADILQLKLILLKLDKISELGVKVFISAGNEGKNYFNIFSLTKDAKNVGALGSLTSKAFYSADNSLVNSWAKGTYEVKRIKDPKGRIGYDYTGDGSIDVYETSILPPYKKTNPYVLYGTSYSAPVALVKELKNSKK